MSPRIAEVPSLTDSTPERSVERFEAAVAGLAQADVDLAGAQEALADAQDGESPRKLADARAGLELAQRRHGQAEAAVRAAETDAAGEVLLLARRLGRDFTAQEREARRLFVEAVADMSSDTRADVTRALAGIHGHDEKAFAGLELRTRRWRAPEAVVEAGPRRALNDLRAIEASIP